MPNEHLHPKIYTINPTEATNFDKIKANFSNYPLKFFVDTGSDISLVKQAAIDPSLIDNSQTVNIKGITEGELKSIGTCDMYFKVDVIRYSFRLHVTDGLIGRDFLDFYDVRLDYGNWSMNFGNGPTVPLLDVNLQCV